MSTISTSNLKGIGRWLPGLIISAIAIILLARFSNWPDVLDAISGMDLGWLFPALGLFVISLGLRALSWWVLLQRKVNYGRVFLTLNEGYLLNNIFPFRLGELGRAFILSETTNLSGFFVLSTIIIERMYDIAIAAGLILATIPLILSLESSQSIAVSVFLLAIAGLFCMFLLASNRGWIMNKLEGFSLKRFVFWDRIVPRINSLLDGFGVLANFRQFILSLVLMVLSWIFGALELVFISKSFGVDLSGWMVAFILGMISIGIAIPSAPAGLGVFEAAAVGAFSLLGMPTSDGLAIAIVVHFVSITFTGMVGMFGIFRDGKSLAGLYQQLRKIRVSNTYP